MDKSDYLRILGLKPGSSLDEVRKAYRIKARKFHPDLNKAPGAADRFIEATEAYEFLIQHFNSKDDEEERKNQIYQEWLKYRQAQARERARAFARAKYSQFKTTGYYKTTSSVDKGRIIYNLLISLLIIIAAIYGYIEKLRMVPEGFDNPSFTGFISLLVIGFLFLAISLIYLIAFYQIKNERRSFPHEKNKKSL